MKEALGQRVPEELKGSSEIIGLEYVVNFDDGLKPRLYVYGISPETGEVYGADVCIGIEIQTGFKPFLTGEKRGVQGFIAVATPMIVEQFVGFPKEEYRNNYEEEMKQKSLRERTNLIRIKNREHVTPAIDRHVSLYAEQFRTFADETAQSFETFMRQHEGYSSGLDSEIPKESQEDN